MGINLDFIRNSIKSSDSFDRLADICYNNLLAIDNYENEIKESIYKLPPQFSDRFIRFILIVINSCNNDPSKFYNKTSTYIALLKGYINRLVNAGLFKNPGIDSKYIPIIVFSADKHELVHESYLYESNSDIEIPIYKDLYYKNDYASNPIVNTNSPEIEKYHKDYSNIIGILTNNAEYEDFIIDFANKSLHQETLDYLELRSKVIYETYIKAKSEIFDIAETDEMDIYQSLTYFISSIDILKNQLDKSASKPVFDSAIRSLYDSIDMIILNFPIKATHAYETTHKDEVSLAIATVKKQIVDKIIKEAFMYTNNILTVNIKDLMDLFDIKVENDSCYCHRIIEDSPLIKLNKSDNSKIIVNKDDMYNVVHETSTNNSLALEAYDKNSSKIDKASRKIYAGYKAYKDAENKVDSQLTKLVTRIKNVFTGGKSARDKIIEGDDFSVIKILKKVFTTAALFSYSKIAALLFVITKHFCSKKATNKERQSLIGELELEIKLLDEKIEDARGDGNRQAKYSMMRTRAELEKALNQIKYGLTADKKSLNTARAVVSGKKSLDYNGPNRDQDE